MAIQRGIAGLSVILLVAACGAPDGRPSTGRTATGNTTIPSTTIPSTTTSSTTASGTAPNPAQDRAGRGVLKITTQLGEQCPHIPVTPDPRCDPKPRADTAFEVRAADGDLVTKGRSDADGRATVVVDPGTYMVRGEPVAGYQFTPERRVTVSKGATVAVPLTYTNGIQ